MDDRMLATLKKRAKRYEAPAEEKKTGAIIGMYVGCRIRDITFGFPSELVLECSPLTHWTPFPGRRHLIGITHLRGDVMALMDLLEAVTNRSTGHCSSMVVLKGSAGRFAVPFSEVIGIREVEMDELLPPEQSVISSPLITAATRDLWFLLSDQQLRDLAETAATKSFDETGEAG